MSQPAKATEPSMEEILASIRRIIADDDATKQPAKPAAATPPEPARPAAPDQPAPHAATQDDIDAVLADLDEPPPAHAAEPDEDVLQLTEDMAAPEPEPAPAPQPAFRRIEATQDVIFDEPAPAPAPSAPPPVARVREPEATPLLSNAASAAVHSAFGNLAHSMLVQNSRTLEDLVKELLRPMLKAWLDDNLPLMVERLVRAEIERVSRGPAS
jgi:cell pole-organizing protein PopZ